MGVASLVLGIIGIVSAITIIISPLGLIGVIVGLILGIVDVVKKGKTGEKRGIGIAGIVICAIMIMVLLVESFISIVGLGVYIFNNAAETLDDTYPSLSSQAVNIFNGKFESYKGLQKGASVKALLNMVMINNETSPERSITVEIDGTTYYNVNNAKTKITLSDNYNVSFDHDNNGYIDEIEIKTTN